MNRVLKRIHLSHKERMHDIVILIDRSEMMDRMKKDYYLPEHRCNLFK